MKALAWHGKRDVRVDNVPDPSIQEPTDAVIRITTTAICGSFTRTVPDAGRKTGSVSSRSRGGP